MRTNKWLTILAGFITIQGLGVHVFASDSDLVLRYRFDQDHGAKVTDHSEHKNDGVNKFGQFMDEVRGRSGVMRFDGEKAVIEATSDSLMLKGDFTYALWVRLNAIEKASTCGIFGGSHYSFALSNYMNLQLTRHAKTAEGDNTAMVWPVDRDILGTDWSHITVVVAYPRIRVFRNGQLIRDAWMPFSLEGPREEGKKVSLGSTGRYFGFIDLDAVTIFNRALSSGEVMELAAGKEPAALTKAPDTEIQMEPRWYHDKSTMRLSASHQLDLNRQEGQAKFHLTSFDGQDQVREVSCMASRSMGTPRTIAAADFPLADFTGKNGGAICSSSRNDA